MNPFIYLADREKKRLMDDIWKIEICIVPSFKQIWVLQNSDPKIDSLNEIDISAKSIANYNFSTIYIHQTTT